MSWERGRFGYRLIETVECASVHGDRFTGQVPDIGGRFSYQNDFFTREQYNSELWLAVKEECKGNIVATGIAELDREIGEGVLEWIQVSKDYRRCGLGSYLVCELLWRMRKAAGFVTVSGKCRNPDHSEDLYRKCGFGGDDVWHVLREREQTAAAEEKETP